MKKLTYLFAFFALSFGLSINAQTEIDDLSDAKTFNTGDNKSIIIGHATTGTLSNANKNVGVGDKTLEDVTTGDSNSVFGWGAGRNIVGGVNNTALGREAAKLLTKKASDMKNEGKNVTSQGAMAKLFASEMCVRVSNEAVQIHGGYGYIKDFPVEKFYRDSKLCTIGEGTSEIQKIVISRDL